MTNPSVFLLAVHNHQPVGNFRSVFETAFKDCYKPFLGELEKHPDVKFTAHYSGPLLEYMEEKERGCWDTLKAMVARGQVELLGGGFYEPILTIIPEEDRQGQIRMMSRFLEEHFQARPRGLWLTERVWEPTLPKTLAQAGIEYTLLDEEHFHYAGVRDIHAYYMTEDEGYPLKLFPIDKKLRYLIPFRPLDDIEGYLAEIQAGGGLAILGDDGEKFGLWPGTRKWVFDDGWLSRFLRFLKEKNVRTRTYSEILDERPPAGRVYLPPASYEEMMEWVLEPEAAVVFKAVKAKNSPEARRFIRGGFFREFFLKYPESDHLNKRMVLVSRKVNAVENDEAAKKELYKGQGNDPIWHGIFGGLYLPHLREAAYEHLLKAEKMSEPCRGWREIDFDLDGRVESIHQDETFGLIVKPSAGGSLVEIDHYPTARNLTDVLSRRQEAYHVPRPICSEHGKSIHELTKALPPEAEKLFRYDSRPRRSALDHFLHPETTLEEFKGGSNRELGDFLDQPYDGRILEPDLWLQRDGHVRMGDERIIVRFQKRIEPRGRAVGVRLSIKSSSERSVRILFASEWNLYQIPEEIVFRDYGADLCGGRIRFEVVPKTEFWHFPLQTLSQSEKGYDIIHQGFCLLPIWPIELGGGKEFEARITMIDGQESDRSDAAAF